MNHDYCVTVAALAGVCAGFLLGAMFGAFGLTVFSALQRRRGQKGAKA